MSERIAKLLELKADVATCREDEVVRLNLADNPPASFLAKFDDLILAAEDIGLNGTAQECNRIAEVIPAATAASKCRREILEEFEQDITAEAPRFRSEFWSKLDALFAAIEKARYEPRPPQFDSVLTMAKQGLPLNQICICWPTLPRAEIQNLIASGDPTKDTDPAKHPDVIAWHKQQATRPRLALAPLIGECAQLRFEQQRHCAATA